MGEVNWYRKIPTQVRAIQYTGDNIDEIQAFTNDGVVYYTAEPALITLEGYMKLHVGGYVVEGIANEFHCVREDIFEKTYLLIEKEDE